MGLLRRERGRRRGPGRRRECLLIASCLLILAADSVSGQGSRRRPAFPTGQRKPSQDLAMPSTLHITHPYFVARVSWYEEELPAPSTDRPATIAAIALSMRSRAILDSRCYLMNGGAVESFFISEDTPVGSVIGTLSVNGDPSEDGNISLKLQERNAAIGIEPGTKNITLLRALDREEKTGPSNVYVNVRCDRRRTTDPSFVIPVSIRVWDVNDNAPAWQGAPYTVRLSELTAVGSRVLQGVRATDADQPGPHAIVHYSVLPGPNSEYFGFANELDSILVVKKPLDYETLSQFTVTLRAEDQGQPPLHSDAQLHVEVLDADDQNPKFTHDHYTILVPDGGIAEGMELQVSPGPVSAVDQDAGIKAPLYYSATGEQRNLVLVEKDSGKIFASDKLMSAELPATIVIKATQYDNADRYALATLSVSRRSRSAPPPAAPPPSPRFTQSAFSAAVTEDTPPGAVLLTLYTNYHRDLSSLPALQFYVSDRSFLDTFAINSAGEVLLRRALDYESTQSYHFQVMVTDGSANDTASLNITVLNVNDWEPRFRYPQYEFSVDTVPDEGGGAGGAGGGGGAGGLLPVGKVEVFDGDRGDYVALSLRGPDASLFYINDMGEMYMKEEALSTLNSSAVHVVATAVDSGTPPRQSSVPVVVHVASSLLAARRGGGRSVAVLGVFVCALTLLATLVLALLVYIYRSHRSKSASTSPSSGFVQHEKVPHECGAAAAPSPAPPAPPSLAAAPSGSLLSVSAGASTILANSSSSLDLRGETMTSNGSANANGRQSQRFSTKTRIAPAPPAERGPPSPPGVGMGGVAGVRAGGGVALMSDHLQGGAAAGRSGVAWPSSTIPARVKKLSWDDAEHPHTGGGGGSGGGGGGGGGGGDAAVLDATNPTLSDHMNLTVYF